MGLIYQWLGILNQQWGSITLEFVDNRSIHRKSLIYNLFTLLQWFKVILGQKRGNKRYRYLNSGFHLRHPSVRTWWNSHPLAIPLTPR